VTVAVVTGASAGVGRATAVELARRGMDVGLLARGAAGLRGAVADVAGHGRQAHAVEVDVADAAGVDDAATAVERELGPIDVWVNDAMTTVFAPIDRVAPEEFRRATEVTYLGQVHGTMAALRRMKARDRGHIVNVGSALAFRGIPLQSAYCGAKFACRGFTEAVRTELLHDGSHVRISMVHLPAVDTPQFTWCLSRLPLHPQPVPPIYPPEVAARAIARVAADGRRAKVLGSYNSLVVLLNKLAPGVLDHYLAATGVSSQQAPFPRAEDQPVDLWSPVDAAGGTDHGASGVFGGQAGGALDGSFLRAVPSSVLAIAVAAARRAREVGERFGPGPPAPAGSPGPRPPAPARGS
jgi:NAD(P)-dependent dehydrogenase (short-subunit alcohol dehydrogenase family)